MSQLESTLIALELIVGLVAIVLFIYYYMRYSPWWETSIGRTVLGQKFAMGALLSLSLLLRVLGPDYEHRALLNGIVLLVLIWFFWKHFLDLREVQKSEPTRDALAAFIRRHFRSKE